MSTRRDHLPGRPWLKCEDRTGVGDQDNQGEKLTHCGLVMPQIWVSIGAGNGLLPGGTKPLPEPMLTYLT